MAAPDGVRDLLEKRRVSIGGGSHVPKTRKLETARDRKAVAKHNFKKGRKM